MADGEIFGIIGLSGAGKSSLVRCINLLERPTSGQVLLDGKDLTLLPRRALLEMRRSIGMIFQNFNLLKQRNVIQNIRFPLEVSGTKKGPAAARAEELLELVGLTDRKKSYPSQLSGGQKQRVAIAGVLAMQPECIVLDEPTAMLDPIGRREVLAAVEQLRQELGMTVVLITHHMEECVRADRLVVMSKGRLAADGTPEAVFSQVEQMHALGLTVPETTELLYGLNRNGFHLPLTALSIERCADAIAGALNHAMKDA